MVRRREEERRGEEGIREKEGGEIEERMGRREKQKDNGEER